MLNYIKMIPESIATANQTISLFSIILKPYRLYKIKAALSSLHQRSDKAYFSANDIAIESKLCLDSVLKIVNCSNRIIKRENSEKWALRKFKVKETW